MRDGDHRIDATRASSGGGADGRIELPAASGSRCRPAPSGALIQEPAAVPPRMLAARILPRRWSTSRPQRFTQLHRLTRVSSTFAASHNRARTALSPHFVMCPV